MQKQSSVGIIYPIQARVDLEIVFSRQRLRLFNMVITPTLTYGSGIWTLSHEHERMIRSTQRKMPRLIVQTKRRYKRKNKKRSDATELTDEERSQQNTSADSEEGNSTSTGCDQDSSILLQSDSNDDMDTADVEEEDRIEYIKRSTRDTEDKMRAGSIPCWIETQRKMKWILAMRIASHSEARWTTTGARWSLGHSFEAKASRRVGRPKKRWDDDINPFVKLDEKKREGMI